MLWSCLPLVEMDEYERKDDKKSNKNTRSRDDNGEHLEMDISRQLSELREQSSNSSDRLPKPDPFGRDVNLRKDGGKTEERQDSRSLNAEENSREIRRGRDGDRGGDRGRGRRRDWGQDRGDYSDGSEESWDGGRDGYRDRTARDEGGRYRGRRDRGGGGYRDGDYRDRDYRDRDYRDRGERDYRDRRDRDNRDWRRDRYDERDDYRRDYRDREKDDHRSRDRYPDDRDYQRREFRYADPTEIVILKGLPTDIEDSQIHELLADANLPYKDVRIVKNREGYSRGFAFVEFIDIDTAKRWIDSNKGKIQVGDSCVYMDFSRSTKGTVETHKDWICSKCGTQNFSSKRRNTCFFCYAPRDENDEQKDIGQTPCKVLILRGLDTLTTEETIRHCLSSFTATPIFDVRLIKDKMTGTSRGFCFIELGSIEEATKLLEEIQNAHFKVDERSVAVSYARFGTQPPITSHASAKSTSTASTGPTTTESSASTPTTQNNFAANAIAQAHAAAKMGNDLMPQQFPAGQPVLPTVLPVYPSDPSVTPAVPTQAVGQLGTPSVIPVQDPAGVPAALSTYVYDTASGFYYDTTTGLYYDPKTQYYYNATTQQYMYWDVTTQQYVAIVSSSAPIAAPVAAPTAAVDPNTIPVAPPAPSDDSQTMSKEKQKKAKSLNAKRIAKDMERWAKKMNVNKDNQARPQAQQSTDDAAKESTYQYDPNELKKNAIKMSFSGNMTSLSLTSSSPLAALSDLDDTQAPAPPVPASNTLVADYGGEDSGGEEEPNKEDNFTDWTKMACLLCKRQFPSKETLTRHNQFSDLHKQNLQVQKKIKMSFTEIDDYERQQREAKYRDRAKERRELFGQPDSTPPGAVLSNKRKRGKGKTYEQPTKDGITSDNIGNKMLQAMGWTQGTGLGRERQGIVAPISAKMRNRTAGLGLDGSDYGAVAGDTERMKLKKMASLRYESLE